MRYIKGAVLAGFILLLGCVGYWGASYYTAQKLTPHIEHNIAKLQDIVKVQYDQVGYSPLYRHVILYNVKIRSAQGDQLWATIKKLAIKIERDGALFTIMSGTINGLQLPSVPHASDISYLYRYLPEDQSAAFALEAHGEEWGSLKANVELGNFKPSLDLLYHYPSVQINHLDLAIHNTELVKAVLYALHKTDHPAATDWLYISFTPQSPFKVAELMDDFPNNLVMNKDFKMETQTEPVSLLGWIEDYYLKLKRALVR